MPSRSRILVVCVALSLSGAVLWWGDSAAQQHDTGLLAQAQQAWREERLPEALEAARRALAADPDLLEAQVVRAQAATALGELDEALVAWKAASKNAPELATNVGVTAAQMGLLTEAEAWLVRAQAHSRAAAAVLFSLYVGHGDRERAKALAVARGWVVDTANHCALTPSEERNREVLAILAVLLHPASADCALGVAQDLTNGGFTRLPRVMLLDLIRAHRNERVRAEAFAFLLHRLPAHDVPPLAESLNILGYRLERRHRQPGLAAAVYEKSVTVDPQFSWPASNLAGLYLGQKQIARALDWARRAVAANPNHQRAQKNLGLAAFFSGQTDEALTAMRRAAELNPDDPESFSLLGRMLVDLKRPEEAVRALVRAVELAPHNEKDRQLLAQLGRPLPEKHAAIGPARDPVAVIDEVLKLSGGEGAFTSLQDLLRAAIEGASEAERIGDGGLVRRILQDEITGERLRVQFGAYLLAHFDGGRFRQFITHEQVPLARRMDALVDDARGVAPQVFAQWAEAAARTAEGQERLTLAERLLVAKDAVSTVLGLLRAIHQSAARVINEGLPPEQQITPAHVEEAVRRLEPQIRESMRNGIAYAYRTASLEELARYLEHLDSDIIRWHRRSMMEAGVRASDVLSEQAFRRIVDARRRVPRT